MKDSSNDHEQFPAFPFLSSNQHLDETNFGKPWSDNPFSPFAAPSKGASATDLDSHDGTAATVSTSGSHTTTEGETTSLGCSSSKNNHHSGSSRPRRNHNNNRKGNMGLGDNGVDSDFLGSLDEAFAKGPSKPSNSKTATTPTSSRRTRGSSPHGDKSVTSHGSQERRHTTSSNAPVRGLARQRSQKRASIAAAVSLMAVGGADKASDIADRRIPRRSKTHEDRLQAAAKMGDLNTGISLGGHAAADNSHTEPRPRRGSRNNNNSKRQEEMFYDDEIHSDEDNESYEAYDRKEDRREKRGGGRRHTKGRSDSDVDLGYGETHQHHQSGGGGRRQNRRQSSDNDPYMGGEGPQTPGGRRNRRNTDSDVELEYGDTREPARRPRLTGKGASKSFDESVGNLRARRRRASVMGANAPSEHTEKTDATGYRARAGRRRASVMGDGGGGGGEWPEASHRHEVFEKI
ncbi:expressed unknown protein [Seminavis robusta]|uniref:Uncharacterized protein n=1 Tax=Seminavis robusta TaxID=568900 RepID=A0A9N8F0A9_9STRA|nr:expressed unknown protein [Seminavis robusta]|eukprot:Sro2561_g331330.1 n/a (461) ;mRNA; r:9646-11028